MTDDYRIDFRSSHAARERRSADARRPGAVLCAVCEDLWSAKHEFLATTPHRPEDLAAASEAIVDSLGFCAPHGFTLLRQHGKSPVVARIFSSATDSILELLSDERRNGERLLELFFAADQACPACGQHEQLLARHIHRLLAGNEWQSSSRGLCFPHYRKVAYAAKSPVLPALAQAQLRLLESVASEADVLAEGSGIDTVSSPLPPERLRRILHIVAGDVFRVEESLRQERDVAVPAARVSSRAMDGRDGDAGCPVCEEIEGTEQRWLAKVKTAAKLREDLWTVFPTCPTHIRQCARVGDARLAAMTLHYAAGVELSALRHGLAGLDRDNRNRETAARSVFHRRQSPAYILGQQRKMITRVPRCPACERLVVAQERGVAEALRTVGEPRRRNAGDRLAHLCLKHFAMVYVHTSYGESRSRLVTTQTEKLRLLSAQWARSSAAGDAAATDAAVRRMLRPWRTAMWHSADA